METMDVIKSGKVAKILFGKEEGKDRWVVQVDCENRRYVFGRYARAKDTFLEKEKEYKIK